VVGGGGGLVTCQDIPGMGAWGDTWKILNLEVKGGTRCPRTILDRGRHMSNFMAVARRLGHSHKVTDGVSSECGMGQPQGKGRVAVVHW